MMTSKHESEDHPNSDHSNDDDDSNKHGTTEMATGIAEWKENYIHCPNIVVAGQI